jgi:hypothetical protein
VVTEFPGKRLSLRPLGAGFHPQTPLPHKAFPVKCSHEDFLPEKYSMEFRELSDKQRRKALRERKTKLAASLKSLETFR